MRPADIDRAGEVWLYRPPEHKGAWRGHSRTIYLGPKAQALLRPFLLRSPDAYCFSPQEAEAARRQAQSEARTTPLSCGNVPGSNRRLTPRKAPGERYSTQSYRQAILYACRKAGVAPWGPNRLRHTRATALRARFGLEQAAIMLGHRDATLTAQAYAERDTAAALRIAAEVG